MSTDCSPRIALQGMTLFLMALATLVCELAIADADASWLRTLGATIAWVAGMLIAWTALSRRLTSRMASLPALGTIALVCLQSLPFGWELVSAAVSGQSHPLEVVLVASFRNVGLCLAAFCARPICLRLAGVASLFLVLFAASLAPDTYILTLVGVYAVAASLWLMMGHWSGLGKNARTRRESRTPIAAALAVSSLLVIIVVVAEVGPERTASVLGELFPSSGGTTWNLPDARDGVNDGDAEVSAKDHAESTGFVDSDLFLDSPDPSLYDVFNELYGEPVKLRDQDRAIAISSNNVLEMESRPVDNHRASRDFAVKRNRPRRNNRPTERAADALLYVRGETPLHLRLAAYDHFDGVVWREELTPAQPTAGLTMSWGNWLLLSEPSAQISAGKLRHQFKIGLLKTQRLPLPPNIYRVRVGAVNRSDFFSWAQNNILRMAAQRVPSGTTIETDLRTVCPEKLREVFIPAMAAYADTKYLHHREQADIAPEIRELAKKWSAGHARGWDQIQAIVDRLQDDYVLDPEAVVQDAEVDATAKFLLETKRGPDYQFASAATLLLRSLRYPARLVSGFYVDPEDYDPATDHTPVFEKNAHFWTEVMLPDRTWIAIEPTPGYRLLGPAPTWSENLWAMVVSVWNGAGRNWPTILLTVVVAAGLMRLRFELLDRLSTLTWRVRLTLAQRRGRHIDRRSAILGSLALIEKRSRWAGAPRPSGQTPYRWHRPWGEAADAPSRLAFERLSALADWAAFSPAPLATPGDDAFEDCRLAVACWTLRRFQLAIAKRRAISRSVLHPAEDQQFRSLTSLWHRSSVHAEGPTA